MKPAFYGATPMATQRCGTPTARRLHLQDRPPAATAGRSPGPATSPGPVKTASCGGTRMARRRCGIPTARAGSPFRIWAPAATAGRSPEPATSRDRPRQRLMAQHRWRYGVVNPNGAGGFTFEDLAAATAGRSPEPATSPGLAKTASYGATPMATRRCENPNGSGGFAFQDLGVVNNRWQIVGTGNFSGIGQSGILWRNTNGDTELWNPNGMGGFTYEDLGVVSTSWSVHKIFA